jgi:RNAse (barnase) inhibitor barstar
MVHTGSLQYVYSNPMNSAFKKVEWAKAIKQREPLFFKMPSTAFDQEREAIRRATEDLHFGMFEIDCNYLVTRTSAMSHLSAIFQFPEWFGKNWDAVFDLLTDLSWLDTKGYLLILLQEEVLERSDQTEAAKLAAVLLSAGTYWSEYDGVGDAHSPKPFHILGVGKQNQHPLISLIEAERQKRK